MLLSKQIFSSQKKISYILSASCFAASLLMTSIASATTVQFQTVMGDFEVNLFDKTTPETVKNFLAYVESDAYENSIIHRSEPSFVVQGGGYKYSGAMPLVSIAQRAKIVNEPMYSNLRGTIAMAKLGGDVNSATNQWFFNLGNNAANLDKQNGGFTVFGQVTGNGIAIIDAIAALNRFNMGGALTAIPLRNYSVTDSTNNRPITDANLMLIQRIVVLNSDPSTADNLTPTKNTLINEPPPASGGGSGGGGGGSMGLVSLLMLGLLALGRKRLLNRV